MAQLPKGTPFIGATRALILIDRKKGLLSEKRIVQSQKLMLRTKDQKDPKENANVDRLKVVSDNKSFNNFKDL